MSSPIEPLLLVIAYLVFVYMGPKWMDSRKPMKLQNVLVFYNFFMVALSAYTVHEMLLGGWLTSYSLSCDQEVDYSTSPTAIRMASATWLFFIAKYIELFDTVFFILRKKQSQVTFLHVFHHGCLPVFWWWGVKAVPGGFGTFHALVNCCVHVVMYLYYGIAALGPDYQKYIWWKKYVTKFQLAQFFIVTVHNSQFLFRTCAYPWKYVAFIQGFTTLIAILFLNFYVQAYRKPKYLQIKSQRISNGVLSNGHEVIGHSNKYSNGAAVNGSIVANGYCRSELKRRPLYS
ncbi:hypothetical protein DPMN_095412 [Dreissena polymorpha]|uniref:Elongation of very long chain fatty acids protein n=2 Tax=Dreissena polymorpha TaxID=45954 RepID=A0A9D4L7B7_DREPO|nr:hypothetical protein DPMN_095412 [Dreissena polymorpha]